MLKNIIKISLIALIVFLTLQSALAVEIQTDDVWKTGTKQHIMIETNNQSNNILKVYNAEGLLIDEIKMKQMDGYIIYNYIVPVNINTKKVVLKYQLNETLTKTITIKEMNWFEHKIHWFLGLIFHNSLF